MSIPARAKRLLSFVYDVTAFTFAAVSGLVLFFWLRHLFGVGNGATVFGLVVMLAYWAAVYYCMYRPVARWLDDVSPQTKRTKKRALAEYVLMIAAFGLAYSIGWALYIWLRYDVLGFGTVATVLIICALLVYSIAMFFAYAVVAEWLTRLWKK